MNIRLPISGLVRPSAASSATRTSVGVSDAQPRPGRFLVPRARRSQAIASPVVSSPPAAAASVAASVSEPLGERGFELVAGALLRPPPRVSKLGVGAIGGSEDPRRLLVAVERGGGLGEDVQLAAQALRQSRLEDDPEGLVREPLGLPRVALAQGDAGEDVTRRGPVQRAAHTPVGDLERAAGQVRGIGGAIEQQLDASQHPERGGQAVARVATVLDVAHERRAGVVEHPGGDLSDRDRQLELRDQHAGGGSDRPLERRSELGQGRLGLAPIDEHARAERVAVAGADRLADRVGDRDRPLVQGDRLLVAPLELPDAADPPPVPGGELGVAGALDDLERLLEHRLGPGIVLE